MKNVFNCNVKIQAKNANYANEIKWKIWYETNTSMTANEINEFEDIVRQAIKFTVAHVGKKSFLFPFEIHSAKSFVIVPQFEDLIPTVKKEYKTMLGFSIGNYGCEIDGTTSWCQVNILKEALSMSFKSYIIFLCELIHEPYELYKKFPNGETLEKQRDESCISNYKNGETLNDNHIKALLNCTNLKLY